MARKVDGGGAGGPGHAGWRRTRAVEGLGGGLLQWPVPLLCVHRGVLCRGVLASTGGPREVPSTGGRQRLVPER